MTSTPTTCPSRVAHYFILEPVAGSLTAGACKHCGYTRVWSTVTQNIEWERAVPSSRIRIERERHEVGLAEEAM